MLLCILVMSIALYADHYVMPVLQLYVSMFVFLLYVEGWHGVFNGPLNLLVRTYSLPIYSCPNFVLLTVQDHILFVISQHGATTVTCFSFLW